MASLLRDVELLATHGDRDALANADLEPALGGSRRFKATAAFTPLRCVDEALVALERNAGVKIVADWVACTQTLGGPWL